MSSANAVPAAQQGAMSRSAFFTFLYKVALSVLTFLNSVLAARYLGKVDRVEFQNAGTIATLGQRFIGGFSSYYSYRLPRDPEQAEAIANMGNLAVFSFSLLVWCVTSVLVFAPLPYVHLSLAWQWALVAMPLNFMFGYGTRLLQGANAMGWLNRANTMQPVVLFVILLPLWFAGRSLPEPVRLTAVYGSWVMSFAITVIATMVVAYQFVARVAAARSTDRSALDRAPAGGIRGWLRAARWSFARPHWLGTLTYGGWFTVANVSSYVNYRIGFWLVLFFIPLRVASDYGIALTASEVLLHISNSVAQVVFTRMVSSERKDAITLTQTSTRQTLVSCGMVAVVMYAVFPWLIVFAYGATYSGAIVPFCILLPGVIFRAAGNVLMQYATNTLGSPQTTVWMDLTSAAINGLLCLLLLPTLQLLGGAIASSASYILTYIIILRWFQRQSQRPLHEMWPLHKSDYTPYVRLARQLLHIH